MSDLVVYKDKTNVLFVDLGYDVTNINILGELRSAVSSQSDLLAEFTVSSLSDGTDGKIYLTLDGSNLDGVSRRFGFIQIREQVTEGVQAPILLTPTRVDIRNKAPLIEDGVNYSELSGMFEALTGLQGLDLNFVTENELSSSLSDYATTESLGDYATTESLSDYATAVEGVEYLSTLADSDEGEFVLPTGSAKVYRIELDDDTVISLDSNAVGSEYLTVILVQDETGGNVVTLPDAYWNGATPPTLTTTANAIDVLTFFSVTFNGATNWFGFAAGLDMSDQGPD